jgi:hypothetical protein
MGASFSKLHRADLPENGGAMADDLYTIEECETAFALENAVQTGDIEAVRALLRDGADPDVDICNVVIAEAVRHEIPLSETTAYEETTILIKAIELDHTEIALLLLEHSKDVDREDDRHKTALKAAVRADNKVLVDALLAKGAGINGIYKNSVDSPLLDAIEAECCYSEMAHYLISRGADVNAVNSRTGFNALSLLLADADAVSLDSIEKLIDAGIDINRQDHMGYTPLIHAYTRGSSEIVKLLIRKGAEIPSNFSKDVHLSALYTMNKIFQELRSPNYWKFWYNRTLRQLVLHPRFVRHLCEQWFAEELQVVKRTRIS